MFLYMSPIIFHFRVLTSIAMFAIWNQNLPFLCVAIYCPLAFRNFHLMEHECVPTCLVQGHPQSSLLMQYPLHEVFCNRYRKAVSSSPSTKRLYFLERRNHILFIFIVLVLLLQSRPKIVYSGNFIESNILGFVLRIMEESKKSKEVGA